MADDYIKRQLPTWMRAVELEPAGERLSAIERSAVDFGKTLSGRDLLDMVLLAHGRSYGDAFDDLQGSIQSHDPTFGCRADDLESSIAACAAVCAALMAESKSSSVAAQGVLSAKWVGLSPAVKELPDLAVVTAHKRSEALRMRRGLPDPSIKNVFIDFHAEMEQSNSSGMATHNIVQLLGDSVETLGDKLQENQLLQGLQLTARLDAADEELQLLWWAFSSYSELAKKRWAELPHEMAALLCGIEFGNKLAFEIELPSTEPLLARLLGPETNELVSLAAAVEATATMLDSMALPLGHPLLPILSSMSEHRALKGEPAWKGSMVRWEINADHSCEKLTFAGQVVRELALMGNISNA